MTRKISFVLLLIFLLSNKIFAQTSLLDTTKTNKVGNKKNAFFIEALGSSSVVGLYYERYINLKTTHKISFQFRIQAGFSPFTFFRFNFSDGVSLPAGLHFGGGGRFKIFGGMMLLNSFFFQPIEVKDYGYNPIKVTSTQYKLFLQPQLTFEYHFTQRFVGKLSFNPTLSPKLVSGNIAYDFTPWGGMAFGYKF